MESTGGMCERAGSLLRGCDWTSMARKRDCHAQGTPIGCRQAATVHLAPTNCRATKLQRHFWQNPTNQSSATMLQCAQQTCALGLRVQAAAPCRSQPLVGAPMGSPLPTALAPPWQHPLTCSRPSALLPSALAPSRRAPACRPPSQRRAAASRRCAGGAPCWRWASSAGATATTPLPTAPAAGTRRTRWCLMAPSRASAPRPAASFGRCVRGVAGRVTHRPAAEQMLCPDWLAGQA